MAEFRWDLFRATFARLDWLWLALGLVFIGASYVGRAVRWAVMIRPMRPHPSYWNLTAANLIGFTAIVLFGRPGELVRPYLIARSEKLPFSSQMAAWFLERIYDLLVVLLLFGYTLATFDASGRNLGQALTWVFHFGGTIVVTACGGCLALLLVSASFPKRTMLAFLGRLPGLPERLRTRVMGLVEAFLDGLDSTRSVRSVVTLVAYTFVEWLIIVASYYCVLRAFPESATLSYLDALVLVGFSALGSIVQIPGLGGGMQIASIVALTELYGLPLESASGLAVLIWIVTFVTVVPSGLVLAAKEGLKWGNLRSIRVGEGIE